MDTYILQALLLRGTAFKFHLAEHIVQIRISVFLLFEQKLEQHFRLFGWTSEIFAISFAEHGIYKAEIYIVLYASQYMIFEDNNII